MQGRTRAGSQRPQLMGVSCLSHLKRRLAFTRDHDIDYNETITVFVRGPCQIYFLSQPANIISSLASEAQPVTSPLRAEV